MDGGDVVQKRKKSEATPPRRQQKKIIIPRRAPSVVVPPRQIVYITADKITCAECVCYPKEEAYVSPKKLHPCQQSPERLYHLAAAVVDALTFPEAFAWNENDVIAWLCEDLGLPQYRDCIIDNHINGMRLLMLEDCSKLAEINIVDFDHIQKITSSIRQLFSADFIRFARSVGLPPRKPLTHCTWFKSRTGPSWGIRRNWTRSDILRWMKIINPEPLSLDHWDLVWYQEPDFPRTKFARTSDKHETSPTPRYRPRVQPCIEYQVPRKFRFQTGIPESEQLIWMERRELPKTKVKTQKPKKKVKLLVPKETRLFPKKISLSGLTGKDLVLARRKMPKPKFLT